MKKEQNLPRPTVEQLNEYDQLSAKLSDSQLQGAAYDEVINKLNDSSRPTTGTTTSSSTLSLARRASRTLLARFSFLQILKNSHSWATITYSTCPISLPRKTANMALWQPTVLAMSLLIFVSTFSFGVPTLPCIRLVGMV
jgi:hypothetical protein